MKNKKILLINPAIYLERNFINYPLLPNLGLLTTASMLERSGYFVNIVDAFSMSKEMVITYSNGKHRFGISNNKIKEAIVKADANIVVIANTRFSDFASSPCQGILELFKFVKLCNSNSFTILADFYIGGCDYISFDPALILKKIKEIDVVNFGESEHTLMRLISLFFEKKNFRTVDGIAFRDEGKIIINNPKVSIDSLDVLPYPGFHLLNMSNYFQSLRGLIRRGFIHEHSENKRILPLFTSRGCPYACIFCASYPYARRKWRASSARYILGEIDYLINKYNIEHFIFMDENMNADFRRFRDLVSGFTKIKKQFTWSVPNGLRADKLTKEVLIDMKKTGLGNLFISAESGEQKVIDRIIKKDLDLRTVVNVAVICRKIKLQLSIHYVIGFPGEKIKDIIKTLNFAMNLYENYNAIPLLQFATPMEGTELYKICKKNSYFLRYPRIEEVPNLIMNESLIKTPHFNPKDLKNIATIFKNKFLNISKRKK